jgi:hypothetical protein
MTAEEFRKRLADLGLTLDEKAFQAALSGAQHLKAESEKLAQWLKP